MSVLLIKQVEKLLEITSKLHPRIGATEESITFDFRFVRAPRRLKRDPDWLVRYLENRGFKLEPTDSWPKIFWSGLPREAIARNRVISFTFDLRTMTCANLFGITPEAVSEANRAWYKMLTFALMYGNRMPLKDVMTNTGAAGGTSTSAHSDRFKVMLDAAEREREALEKFRTLGGFKAVVAEWLTGVDIMTPLKSERLNDDLEA